MGLLGDFVGSRYHFGWSAVAARTGVDDRGRVVIMRAFAGSLSLVARLVEHLIDVDFRATKCGTEFCDQLLAPVAER